MTTDDQMLHQRPFGPAYRFTTASLIALITIVAFEFMAIGTAMPAVAKELDAVASYGSAFSVMLILQLLGIVLAGVWTDSRGPLPAVTYGQILFAIGAAICGLAQNFPVLLVGRGLTGLGAGLLIVALFVVIGRVYPEQIRPRVFSWISAAWVLPSLIGAPVAGWLTTAWTWRLVFWVVVLPTVVTFFLIRGQSHLIARPADDTGTSGDSPDSDPQERAAHLKAAKLGVLIAISAGILQAGANGLTNAVNGYAVAAVAGLLAVFFVFPRLTPPGTLRLKRGLPSVIACRFLLNGSFNGALTYVPLMLVNNRGVDIRMAGWLIALGSIGWTIGSWIQGNSRFDQLRHHLVTLGAVSLTTGVGILTVVGWTGTPWPVMVAGVCFAGLGMGLASTTLSVLALKLAPPEEHGRASSALQVSDVLGSVIGIAGASAVFAVLHPVHGHDGVVYGAIWAYLTAMAALAIVGGRRCRC